MYWYWWGMSWFWWSFWLIAIVCFALFLVPVPRARYRQFEDPLRLLARRYAAGELTHEEYEERRARLERDLVKRPPAATPRPAPPPIDTTTTTPQAT